MEFPDYYRIGLNSTIGKFFYTIVPAARYTLPLAYRMINSQAIVLFLGYSCP
jgi:hypothetical protein